ncbi:MAG: hypothetical protein ACPGOY_02145 [Rhodospirillaceae bacterium]
MRIPNPRPLVCILAVLMLSVLPADHAAQAYSGEIFAVCGLKPEGDNYLTLRDCAAADCPEVMRLPAGSFVWTDEPFPEGDWRSVVVMQDVEDLYPVDRPRGYVHRRYICKHEG